MVSSPPVLSGLMAAKLARPIEDALPPRSHAAPVGRPDSGNELPARDEHDFRRQSEEAEVDISEMLCLHGAKAAMRHAVTELLFFSSIGDLTQLQRVCRECKLNVRILVLWVQGKRLDAISSVAQYHDAMCSRQEKPQILTEERHCE